MLNIILFGPPGSGKGTQADGLVKKYGLLHISTGDLFRSEIAKKTELGLAAKAYMDAGNLLPDAVTIGMLRSTMAAHPEVNGFLLDGFPRTIPQAQALDVLLSESGESVTQLIAMQVNEDELVARLLNRAVTSGRTDDSDETIIRNRMKNYKEQTTPVADYYATQHKTTHIDGMGTVDAVFARLSKVVDSCLV